MPPMDPAAERALFGDPAPDSFDPTLKASIRARMRTLVEAPGMFTDEDGNPLTPKWTFEETSASFTPGANGSRTTQDRSDWEWQLKVDFTRRFVSTVFEQTLIRQVPQVNGFFLFLDTCDYDQGTIGGSKDVPSEGVFSFRVTRSPNSF